MNIPTLIMLLTTSASAEVLAIDVDVQETVGHGSVAGLVRAPVAEVADLVADCDQMSTWFPDIVMSTRLHGSGGVDRCRGQTDLPWPLEDRTWTAEIARGASNDGGEVISFHYVPGSGNLAAMDGRYVLRPTEGGTVVDYEISIDLGFWIPKPLVLWATEKMLPEIIAGLARRLDG